MPCLVLMCLIPGQLCCLAFSLCFGTTEEIAVLLFSDNICMFEDRSLHVCPLTAHSTRN